MAFHLPFEFQHWFVNVFSGSLDMFVIIALMIIAGMAAMFRMTNLILGVMVLLFFFILGTITDQWTILGIILVGAGAAWVITRFIKQ